jgi:hypothetical protein
MPLLDLWHSRPETLSEMSLKQVVVMAGDGRLRDGSEAADELRRYLSEVSSEKLSAYAAKLIEESFQDSGLVLQDLVNELGRRLEYKVENGRYRGRHGEPGFDGLWQSPQGKYLVVEVKTTDSYQIDLDKIAEYRNQLAQRGKINQSASILIVVGREDTGGLEAQIRGSRHAWDMRLISVEALVKLAVLKESTDEEDTLEKIRNILVPFEYTRLDNIIDVMFSAAKDAEAQVAEREEGPAEEAAEAESDGLREQTWTDTASLQEKRKAIISALGRREGRPLIAKSRTQYWSSDQSLRACCTISKRYDRGIYRYWYAYHPRWDSFLGEGQIAYFVLGGMDIPIAFAVPLEVMREHRDELNTTTRPTGETYWHIHVAEQPPEHYVLVLHKSGAYLPIDEYAFPLEG